MPASEFMDIIVRLRGKDATADVKKLDKEIDKLPRSVKLADKAFSGLHRSIKVVRSSISGISTALFSLKGLVAAAGLGVLAHSFTQAASTAEQYRTRLTVLLGSVDEGNRLFQSMAQYASGVSFQYEEVMGAATALTGVVKGGVDEVNKWIPLIGDLAAASGLDIQTATSQVIRMYSAGAAAADLFRERGILSMLGFQAGVSTSAEETKKKLIAAWEDPLSKFRGASALLATTWQGLLSMMGDAWFQFRTMVMESGVFDFMKAAVSVLLDDLRELRESGDLQKWSQDLSDALISGMKKIGYAVAAVGDAWRGWLMIWNILKGAYATVAPFILSGLSVISEAVAGVARGFFLLADTLGINGVAGAAKDVASIMEDISKNAQDSKAYWEEVKKSAAENVQNLARQETYTSKVDLVMGRINTKMEEWKKKQEELNKLQRPKRKDELGQAKASVKLTAELSEFKAQQQTVLQELNILYKKGEVEFEDFWKQRRESLIAAFNKEKEVLRAQEQLAIDEKKPDKVRQINAKIFSLEQKQIRDLRTLDQQKEADEKKIADNKLAVQRTLQDAQLRARTADAFGLTAQYQKELIDLQRRQEEETKSLEEHNATKAELNDLFRAQELEKENLLADQKKRLMDATLGAAKQSLGFMGDAFGSMYEATGKKYKAFAKAQRVTQIALAVITTYQSAIDAYQSALKIPYVGIYLAPVAAATAVAAGLAKVAAMRAQPLARGGKVKGSSPTTTADNIPIAATAGEFMQPVSSVRKYGLGAMEAIRRGVVPPELLSGFNLRGFRAPSGSRLQAGGLASASAAAATAGKPQEGGGPKAAQPGQPITIVNVMDPNEFDQFLWSPQGTDSIVNIIASNQDRIRRIQQQ